MASNCPCPDQSNTKYQRLDKGRWHETKIFVTDNEKNPSCQADFIPDHEDWVTTSCDEPEELDPARISDYIPDHPSWRPQEPQKRSFFSDCAKMFDCCKNRNTGESIPMRRPAPIVIEDNKAIVTQPKEKEYFCRVVRAPTYPPPPGTTICEWY